MLLLSVQVYAGNRCVSAYTAIKLEEADLHYTDFDDGGILRLGGKDEFTYVYRDDRSPVRGRNLLKRIESLNIPPGFKKVWISEDARDHIQAKGVDEKGRIQYIYHPEWVELREQKKYERILSFGEALPSMRNQLSKHLRLPGLPKQKVLAIAVKILEITQIRVGDRKYLSENGTYGLTTLTKRKAILSGKTLQLNFRGKHNKKNDNSYDLDSKFADVLEEVYSTPGVRWLRYRDEKGIWRDFTPDDVNEYIREISAGRFSAKDYRTWYATVFAADFLFGIGKPYDEHPQDHIDDAVSYVADRLVNTENVSRESYIFPGILSAFEEWAPFAEAFEIARKRVYRNSTGRSLAEEAVLVMLSKVSVH